VSEQKPLHVTYTYCMAKVSRLLMTVLSLRSERRSLFKFLSRAQSTEQPSDNDNNDDNNSNDLSWSVQGRCSILRKNHISADFKRAL